MRLDLYYPVRPFTINQHFGNNIPCVKNFGLPTQTIVDGSDNTTCPVGYDKLYPHFGMEGHNGTDLAAGEQPVYAACAGTVIEKQVVPARGLGLGILTDEPVDLDGVGTHYMKLRYWHLKSFLVEVGQHVEAGQQLGVTDNTGYSSGNHLHFEGQPMDKDAGGHPGYTLVAGAIAGAISIEPYFNGKYADELHPSFHYNFMVNLSFGQTSVDILNLQKALTLEGVFPATVNPTGFYGGVTAKSVLAFRLKYKISSATDPQGHSVGPLTRAQLNSLYSK